MKNNQYQTIIKKRHLYNHELICDEYIKKAIKNNKYETRCHVIVNGETLENHAIYKDIFRERMREKGFGVKDIDSSFEIKINWI